MFDVTYQNILKTITFVIIKNNYVSMKYLFNSCLLVALLFTAFACSRSQNNTSVSATGAVIEFENLEHDFGTIPYKGDGSCEFIFKSKGEVPLVLKNVRSSCGCTVPSWPKDPIAKGQKGTIKVVYDTRVTGGFKKSISVFSNASEAPIVLVIKGRVEEENNDLTSAPAK